MEKNAVNQCRNSPSGLSSIGKARSTIKPFLMRVVPMHSVPSHSGTFFDTSISWRRNYCMTIAAFGP